MKTKKLPVLRQHSLRTSLFLFQTRLFYRFFDMSINTSRKVQKFLFSGQDLIKTYHFALTLSRCICNKIWPCWHVSRWVPNINYSHLLGWPINWKTSEAFLMRLALGIRLLRPIMCGIFRLRLICDLGIGEAKTFHFHSCWFLILRELKLFEFSLFNLMA